MIGDCFSFSYAVSVRWEREYAAACRRRQRREDQQPPERSSTSSSGPITESHTPCLTFTIEDFNRYFCCCARRVGSMFFLVERKDGSPIIVAGPCWPFCSFVTVPLIVVCSGLVGYFIVSNPNTGLVSILSIRCKCMYNYVCAFILTSCLHLYK